MKTGLSKKQNTTTIYFDEDSPMIEVSTYNTDLKNRLAVFANQYPKECKLVDDDARAYKIFEVKKGWSSFRRTAPTQMNAAKLPARWQKQKTSGGTRNEIIILCVQHGHSELDYLIYNDLVVYVALIHMVIRKIIQR